jgi:hypothetical protein
MPLKLTKSMAQGGAFVCWRMDLGDKTLVGVIRVHSEAEAVAWVRSQPIHPNVTYSYSPWAEWEQM